MKNRGNKAKEYLKKKDFTFSNAANFVHFECKFAQIRQQKEQKHRLYFKAARSCGLHPRRQGEARPYNEK